MRTRMGWFWTQGAACECAGRLAWFTERALGPDPYRRYEVERAWPGWRVVKTFTGSGRP